MEYTEDNFFDISWNPPDEKDELITYSLYYGINRKRVDNIIEVDVIIIKTNIKYWIKSVFE